MTIAVYIDSCAWNYLHKNVIDLADELPAHRYSIYVTREVEIELSSIPDVGCDGNDKSALKAYIKQGIDRLPVATSYVFGFQSIEPDGTPSPVQVYGGFNVGTFQSEEERNFYARPEIEQQLQSGKKSNSGLGKNQADASLAAKSVSSIVLTNERMNRRSSITNSGSDPQTHASASNIFQSEIASRSLVKCPFGLNIYAQRNRHSIYL